MDLRYRIDALYKLALSAYNAENYEDTIHFVKKAMDKNPTDLEILSLIDKVRAKDPNMDLSYFDTFLEQRKRAGTQAAPQPLPQSPSTPQAQPQAAPAPAVPPQAPKPQARVAENVPLGFITHRQENLNPLSVKEAPTPVRKVKEPVATKVPVHKEEPASPTKVLKPAVKAPEVKKPAFKNPEISDLFNFDDIHQEKKPQSIEPEKKVAEPPKTSAGRRAKATEDVIKKLLSKKSLTDERSELYKQVKRQLDEFKEEGFVVTKLEQALVSKNPDMRKVLDDLVIMSAHIDQLRELGRLLDEASGLPDVNKAKVFSIKLKMSDPDRVTEIKRELDQLLASASLQNKAQSALSAEAQTNIKNLLELGRTAMKQGNNQSAQRFFGSVLEIDPANLEAQQELERLGSAQPAQPDGPPADQ